jgi:hypothetical protein
MKAMPAALRHGDIVTLQWRQDADVEPASAPAPAPSVLALVENAARGGLPATAWSPFATCTGTSLFRLPQDGLAVTLVGHIRLQDAWTVIVQTDREHRLTVPLLIGLERRARLRIAFLSWFFEARPGVGQDVDLDTLLYLVEL